MFNGLSMIGAIGPACLAAKVDSPGAHAHTRAPAPARAPARARARALALARAHTCPDAYVNSRRIGVHNLNSDSVANW